MKTTCFILLTFSALQLFAQKNVSLTTKNKKAIAYYQQSKNPTIRRQYEEALRFLNLALEKDDEFVEAYFAKAKIYDIMHEGDQANNNFSKAVSLAPQDPRFSAAYYYMAEFALKQGEYKEAKSLVNKFYSIQPMNRTLASSADKILKSIKYTEENIGKSLPFNPAPLPDNVNRLMLQYFPVLTADQETIFFTGREGLSGAYDEDIYVCEKDENGEWQDPKSISNVINTSFNEGTCTISGDGRKLIFTSCLGRKTYGGCDLFVSYKQGDEWSKPKNLGVTINSRYWESQPSLSSDGRTLYFVSDRRGGIGNRDIYVSYLKKDGTWSPALNLGKPVNTEDDEVSPFIHANGSTLYFSSDGHPGFGSFDLFSTETRDQNWSEPKNLGYPINTYEEQVSLFVTSDGKKGYYANENLTNRVGAKSALYEFNIPEELQLAHKSNFVKGRIIDSETNEYLSANVELIDLTTTSVISTVESDKTSGEYLIVLTEGADYGLYVNKKGYLFKSLTFNYESDASLEPVYIDIYLDPIKKGKLTILNNLFFDFDKYELKEKSGTELDKLIQFLAVNPSINIGIAGHTDNAGKESYNKELSINRAKSVYNYLAGQGVAKERLRFRGYGQEKPIAPNDSEENRSKNRRIEFVIL